LRCTLSYTEDIINAYVYTVHFLGKNLLMNLKTIIKRT